METRKKFKLSIPEDRKADIFRLATANRDHYLANKANKRDKLRQLSRVAGEAVNILEPVDLARAWSDGIAAAEASDAVTIFEFWRTLAKSTCKRFFLEEYGGHATEAYQQPLLYAVHSALVQALFTQFATDPNIYACAQRFADAVPNHTLVDWTQVDSAAFKERLQALWSAWHPLLMNSPEYYHLNQGLPQAIGLTESDFTRTFLGSSPFKRHAEPQLNATITRDVFTIIANFLADDDLHQFRQTCLSNYNLVEQNTTTRLRHRLHMIRKNTLLKEFFGTVHFMDQHYLITNIETLRSNYEFRITALTNEMTTHKFRGRQGQWDKMTGAYLTKDEDGFTILSAYRCSVYSNEFWVQCLQLPTLDAKYTLENYRVIKFTHPSYKTEHNGEFVKPVWERLTFFARKGDQVSIRTTFTERANIMPNSHHAGLYETGVVHTYEAEFEMASFAEKDKTIACRRV